MASFKWEGMLPKAVCPQHPCLFVSLKPQHLGLQKESSDCLCSCPLPKPSPQPWQPQHPALFLSLLALPRDALARCGERCCFPWALGQCAEHRHLTHSSRSRKAAVLRAL